MIELLRVRLLRGYKQFNGGECCGLPPLEAMMLVEEQAAVLLDEVAVEQGEDVVQEDEAAGAEGLSTEGVSGLGGGRTGTDADVSVGGSTRKQASKRAGRKKSGADAGHGATATPRKR